MSHNGFGKYLPSEATEAAKRRHPSYRRGLGQYMDGSREASTAKRSQLAELRRGRIKAAISTGECKFGYDGKPLDPLADDADAIEAEWVEQFGGNGGNDAT
ncbi:hypothetical protein K8O93_06750 [Gordonia bronchialis]|uniref:hypothetical protein n=1 Tax=Gordonia bronchialis TaxID=2054 RepID=UPI001CBF53A7|nr:hypothetical protein [Gordonia bronchialis]UAK39373.1 hypothetical protein K8O93_06750 [Gordonia bronchialis]